MYAVKNKILYRRAKLVAIQSAIRGYRAKKEFRPRIRGMMKIKALYDQLGPMKELVAQLKKDKDGAKKIAALEKDMDGVLNKIQVWEWRASVALMPVTSKYIWVHKVKGWRFLLTKTSILSLKRVENDDVIKPSEC